MKNQYVKPAWRKENVVKQLLKNSRLENVDTTEDEIRRLKRIEILASKPEVAEAELQRSIDRRLERGMRPCRDTVKVAPPLPPGELSKHRAKCDELARRRKKARRR